MKPWSDSKSEFELTDEQIYDYLRHLQVCAAPLACPAHEAVENHMNAAKARGELLCIWESRLPKEVGDDR